MLYEPEAEIVMDIFHYTFNKRTPRKSLALDLDAVFLRTSSSARR